MHLFSLKLHVLSIKKLIVMSILLFYPLAKCNVCKQMSYLCFLMREDYWINGNVMLVVLSCWLVMSSSHVGLLTLGAGGGSDERLYFKVFLCSVLIISGQLSSSPYLYNYHFLTPLFEPQSPHVKLKMDQLIKLSGVKGY